MIATADELTRSVAYVLRVLLMSCDTSAVHVSLYECLLGPYTAFISLTKGVGLLLTSLISGDDLMAHKVGRDGRRFVDLKIA